MIGWTIAAAQASGVFDGIFVSTDDEEIADVAVSLGAEAPFRRPPELADDLTPTIPVIRHALAWIERNRGPVSAACCAYATAPLLQPRHLAEALAELEARPLADFVFSATSFAYPIQRALEISGEGAVRMFWPENDARRSQDLRPAFHDAGQFYWGRPQAFASHRGFFADARSYAFLVPRHLVQDIDTPEDWDVAERMMHAHCALST